MTRQCLSGSVRTTREKDSKISVGRYSQNPYCALPLHLICKALLEFVLETIFDIRRV